jgi:hypothetical protein
VFNKSAFHLTTCPDQEAGLAQPEGAQAAYLSSLGKRISSAQLAAMLVEKSLSELETKVARLFSSLLRDV